MKVVRDVARSLEHDARIFSRDFFRKITKIVKIFCYKLICIDVTAYSFLAQLPPPAKVVAVQGVTGVSDSQAICVEKGAHAHIAMLTASGFTSAGVEVRDVNSYLTMRNCNLSNACPSAEAMAGIGLKPTWTVPALWVHACAKCEVSECVLSGCSHGAGVEDPGTSLQVRIPWFPLLTCHLCAV
jgi:hypothetical protein